jgi:hypothetical protein
MIFLLAYIMVNLLHIIINVNLVFGFASKYYESVN